MPADELENIANRLEELKSTRFRLGKPNPLNYHVHTAGQKEYEKDLDEWNEYSGLAQQFKKLQGVQPDQRDVKEIQAIKAGVERLYPAASSAKPGATKTSSTVKPEAQSTKTTDATTQNTIASPSKPAASAAESSDRPKTAAHSVNRGTQGSPPPLKPETPKPKVSAATVSAPKPETKTTTISGNSNAEFKDYYKLLGQPQTASVPALMKACVEKSVSLNLNKPEHKETFGLIQEAYNTFKDPDYKAEYDKKYNENKPADSSVEISGKSKPKHAAANKGDNKQEENAFIQSTAEGVPQLVDLGLKILGNCYKCSKFIGDLMTGGKVTSAENTLKSSMSSLAEQVKQFATDFSTKFSIQLAGAVLNTVGKSLQDPEGPVAKVPNEGVQQLANLAQKQIPGLLKQINDSGLGIEDKQQLTAGLSAIKQGADSILQMQPAAPSRNASQELKSAAPSGEVGIGNGLSKGINAASRLGNITSAATQAGKSPADIPIRPSSAPSPSSAPRPAPLTSRKRPGNDPTPGSKTPAFPDATGSGGEKRPGLADKGNTSIKTTRNTN